MNLNNFKFEVMLIKRKTNESVVSCSGRKGIDRAYVALELAASESDR